MKLLKNQSRLYTRGRMGKVLIEVALFLVLACSQSSEAQRSNALLIYKGAEGMKLSQEYGMQRLQYYVKEPYPGSSVINWVADNLKNQGWKPLSHYYLNPQVQTIKEWTEFTDSRQTPQLRIRRWALDWENPSGDVVSYSFEYRYPNNATPNLTQLHVLGIYVPKAVADRNREVIKNLHQEQK